MNNHIGPQLVGGSVICTPMLSYSDIKPGTSIELDGEPYFVLESRVFRKQQRKPVNQTKLRNLQTGNVIEHTFQQSDKAEEADLARIPIVFIYEKRGEYTFHSKDDPSDRFSLSAEIVGTAASYLLNGMEITGLRYGDSIIGVQLPIKIDQTVADAPPNIKGNTAQGGTKRVTLKSGAEVTVPMFIDAGDVIRINTQTGQYDTRVSKAS